MRLDQLFEKGWILDELGISSLALSGHKYTLEPLLITLSSFDHVHSCSLSFKVVKIPNLLIIYLEIFSWWVTCNLAIDNVANM